MKFEYIDQDYVYLLVLFSNFKFGSETIFTLFSFCVLDFVAIILKIITVFVIVI